jgi:hypothetical protein
MITKKFTYILTLAKSEKDYQIAAPSIGARYAAIHWTKDLASLVVAMAYMTIAQSTG